MLPQLFIFSGCKKENKTESGTYYYKANIGGIEYSQNVTETNGYEAGSAVNGGDDVSLSATINPSDYPAPAKSTAMDITKGMLHTYSTITDEQFLAFFTPGNYQFSSSSQDGFVIDWFDENDVQWSTDKGSGDQTNSTIKVISAKDSRSIVDYYAEVKLQFSCKLYNDSDEVRELKNGEFVGLFGEF
jgi:hypothetical protein